MPSTRDTEAACQRLPFFPLPRVVLFPGALLPLHIFEPRYRQMVADVIAGHGAIAMALPLPSEEPRALEPEVHAVAGLGWIAAHERLGDGRYEILLEGAARVRLHELPREGPYRIARAEVLSDEPAGDGVRVQVLMSLAMQIAAQVRRHEPRFELDLPAEASPGALCDRLANRLVRDPVVRQRVLETLDPRARIAIVEGALAEVLNELGDEGGGPSS
jgi:ATP-dependent Lon protease